MGALDEHRRSEGRPTKYKPEYCEKIIEIAKSKVMIDYANQCCVALEITSDTFWRWCKEIKEFSEAYKKGRHLWKAKLDDAGIYGDLDYKYYRTSVWQGLRESADPDTKVKQDLTLEDAARIHQILKDV